MPAEEDTFGDREAADLLRRWGEQVRRPEGLKTEANLFEPPGDLGHMHRALDIVDGEIAQQGASVPLKIGRSWWWWWRGGLAAASLVLVIGGGWFVRGVLSPDEGTGTSRVLVLGDLRLSSAPTLLRGESETQFRSGDPVYIHFAADRPGTAFVAMLDSQSRFAPLSSDVHAVKRGPNLPKSARLDHEPGTESFVILYSAHLLSKEDFVGIVREAESAVTAGSKPHAVALKEILTAVRADPRIEADAITFEHLP